MKKIITGLFIGIISLAGVESFAQLASNDFKADTTQRITAKVKTDSLPSRVYNDLPRMPKKKEPANKLLLEDKKVIKKTEVKHKYKKERRKGTRVVKKVDKKHGIMAERKKKDRMFKGN